jgi:hypothetical protein
VAGRITIVTIDPFDLIDRNDRAAVEARFNRFYESIGAEIDRLWAEIGPTTPGSTLYHYTNAGGLKGIVSSSAIFLTDAFFLNDKSELSYGRELVLNVLTERRNAAVGVLETFYASAINSFDPFGDGPFQFAYYVASFCENGNLLSQWRAYGGGGAGYALGFASEPLLNPGTLLAAGVAPAVLHRIEYDRVKQRRLIEYAVDRCAELLHVDLQNADSAFQRDVLLSGWFAVLAIQLTGLFPQFKHPMFSEEREWRLTLSRLPHDEKGILAFRELGNDVIPYILFELKLRATGLLPLREIVLAPASEPELRRRALSKFLAAKGYPDDSVKLVGSDIPLRVRS